jgi:hypothetical protein
MKRIVSGLLAVFLVDWVSFAEARDTEVVLYPTIGPASVPSFGIVSPSFAGFAANTLFGLQNGRRDVGGRILFTPTAFNTIGGPISNRSGKVKVSVYDTWATKGNSWRGLTPSHGPFANERGTQFRAAVAIKSRTAFSLADVVLSVTYADLPPGTVISLPLGGLPGQGLFQSFESNRLRGIDWGPDGRPGGGDDTVYDSNNPGKPCDTKCETKVNEVLFVGQGELGFADPSDSASDVEQFAAYLDYLKANAPYTFTYTFTLRGVSSKVVVAVDLTARPGQILPPGRHHRFRPFRLYPIR